MNIIREKLPVEDFREVEKYLSSSVVRVDAYIDSFISGAILTEDKLIIDEKFNQCQQKFYDIQQILKHKLEEVEAKLS